MASKRAIRRRSCSSKVKHPSKDVANIVIKKLDKKGELNAYKCQFCGGWHVGRPSQNIIQGFAARAERPKTMKRLGD